MKTVNVSVWASVRAHIERGRTGLGGARAGARGAPTAPAAGRGGGLLGRRVPAGGAVRQVPARRAAPHQHR